MDSEVRTEPTAERPEIRELRRRAPWSRPQRVEVFRRPPGGAPHYSRIMERSGTMRGPLRIGLSSPWHEDLYHEVLVLPWWKFLLFGMGAYLGLNLVFAGLFTIQPNSIGNARPGAFADAFFFSVQTMATIGYGVLTPVGVYANVVVTAETMVSLIFTAFLTGATFARFSRPTARVNFSRAVTVAPYNGVPTLSVRMTNARQNQILEADVSMTLLCNEISAEGHLMRRFYDLKLSRGHTPIFALSFTAMHQIDADSPLHGATPDSLAAQSAELLVTVTGLDGTMAQTIHARASYQADEIAFGHRFRDMFGYTRQGRVVIDLTRFDDLESVEHAGVTPIGGDSGARPVGVSPPG